MQNSRNKHGGTCKLLQVFGFTFIATMSPTAFAAAGDCLSNGGPGGFNYPPAAAKLQYRINANDAAAFGLSAAELQALTMLGADTWNQQGNNRSFEYVGTTNFGRTDLVGTSAADCAALGITTSIVHFENANSNSYAAVALPICCPNDDCATVGPLPAAVITGGNGTGNHVFFHFPVNNGGAFTGIGNGFNGAAWDLPGGMVHETGHTIGSFTHVGSNEGSVMNVVPGENPIQPKKRYLWEYDNKCSLQFGGTRAASAIMINQNIGVLGSPVNIFGGSQSIAKANVGLNYVSGTATFATTYHRGSAVSFSSNAGTSYTDVGASNIAKSGMGFALGLWREDTSVDRVLYSSWQDTAQYSTTADHYALTAYSSNKFSSTSSAALKYCQTMTGFLQCTNAPTETIRTGGVLSNAWWNGGGSNDRTVVAWANMNRTAGGLTANANEVWITVGYISAALLPTPTKTGFMTAVPPAVACSNNYSSSYDCILAFVPTTSNTAVIQVRRFSIGTGGGGAYSLTFDPVGYSLNAINGRASSALAAYRHNGKFYIAFRRAAQSQFLALLESTDGATWSVTNLNIDATITAPSAAGVWQADNRIVYVK